MNENIQKTIDFLNTAFDASAYFSCNPQQKAYRLAHTMRVANIGAKIAQAEGFDTEATTIACLLHDVAYCNASDNDRWWKEHGRASACIARPFLDMLDIAPETAAAICFGIAIHVDDQADFPGEHTPFAQTIGDSDNIDRFGVYRLHETLEAAHFTVLPLAEQISFSEKKLEALENLKKVKFSTKTADCLWREQLDFQISFFKNLLCQLRDSTLLAGEVYIPQPSAIFPPIIRRS